MTGLDAEGRGMTPLEPLLSIDEAADLLRISDSGIYRLIRKGALMSVKVGGRTLIEPGAIRAFIAASRRDCGDGSTDETVANPGPQEEAA
jgi:excisionase family DNA binding protein